MIQLESQFAVSVQLFLADAFERFCGVRVLRVEFERLAVIPDGEVALPCGEIGFAEAVVGVEALRVGFDVELEDFDGLFDLPRLQQAVADRVQLRLGEVVDGRLLRLQVAVLRDARLQALLADGLQQHFGDRHLRRRVRLAVENLPDGVAEPVEARALRGVVEEDD